MKSKLDFMKANNPILEIQLNLRDIAQVHADIPKVLATGIYDAETQNAVKIFQMKFNLPVTGKVDLITWRKILNEHNCCIQNITPAQSVTCFPNNKLEYKIGDESNLIYILQIILNNFAKKFKNYEAVQLTGIFDESTEIAVKQFQKLSNLPVTGALDKITWNNLNKINHTCRFYE